MVRPVVSAHTERIYAAIPEAYRDADQGDLSVDGWPLLRYLSLMGDRGGAVEAFFDRADQRPDHPSQLLDPATADEGWLAWLAQVRGLSLGPGETLSRESFATARPDRGSVGAIRREVTKTLVSTNGRVPRVIVRPVEGDPFRVQVATYAAQTPDRARALAAAVGQKPAGVVMEYATRTRITWGEFSELGITFSKARSYRVRELTAMIP